MKLIVDRIESDKAVCEKENGQIEDIRLCDLPFIPKEGDVLFQEGSTFRFSHDETKKRRLAVEKLADILWE